MPKFHKITAGFVDQEYDEYGQPIAQEFVAGDDVSYENQFGEPIGMPADETYQPFNMVQPVTLLEEPLTAAQLRHDPNIDVTIAVPLSVVIDNDFEELMDHFEENILDDHGILSGISYEMVGCDTTLDLVYFHVEAYADLMGD